MIEKILPGLHRVVVPLPGNPLKEINSYVLTSSDRNLIIDTGMKRPECQEVLEAGLDEIGVDLERTDFISTHLHADHAGLISTLLRSGSRAFMGTLDAQVMKIDFAHLTKTIPLSEYAIRSGFPAEEVRASLHNHPGNKYSSETRVPYIPLEGGETFEVGAYRLEVVATPGHTNGHISLYEPEKKIFFSGDHVLGRGSRPRRHHNEHPGLVRRSGSAGGLPVEPEEGRCAGRGALSSRPPEPDRGLPQEDR
jgi:glyoxylase-like metal-dependent hydrolase (beta-lactamase superfamily II)